MLTDPAVGFLDRLQRYMLHIPLLDIFPPSLVLGGHWGLKRMIMTQKRECMYVLFNSFFTLSIKLLNLILDWISPLKICSVSAYKCSEHPRYCSLPSIHLKDKMLLRAMNGTLLTLHG